MPLLFLKERKLRRLTWIRDLGFLSNLRKRELKGQKVVVKKELITLGLLEWNKSRVTTKIPKYGKKVPKIVNIKKELIALWLLEWNKSLVTTVFPKYGKKVPKIVNVKVSPRNIQQPR
ncbi:hypothetical protein KY290_005184 [Solanum tuberosum]|uniref:Uncharacterized protein n=1 Tax=Solanum tuberosum TaxID=4113 RepID=A0ABQ7WFU9_SOLTU|nr:hypothetical protein KY289_005576 [Solanum tuberosum]KAH0751918.1 hypothetical protein KY285_005066 [Solanum tuberosum]KAH0778757.1 hypothetical protein KY290_005184 [Solanum tuberosum]